MRIGIVNDLGSVREMLRRLVEQETPHEVAWTAADGEDAVGRANRDRPDLILMDLVMPVMDGAEATRRIMAECPCGILAVTASISSNLALVYEAMGRGALDAVDTPRLTPAGSIAGAEPLLTKIAAIERFLARRDSTDRTAGTCDRDRPTRCALALVGASTGGPAALLEYLQGWPRDAPACLLLAQHVDPAFAPGLAEWLTRNSDHRVELAAAGIVPHAGQVLMLKTYQHGVIDECGQVTYRPRGDREAAFHVPSIDLLFRSVAEADHPAGAAALLTGMGRDGACGLLELRRRGWFTLAQDRASSVIWGMPRAAVELGAADHQGTPARIARLMADHLVAGARRARIGRPAPESMPETENEGLRHHE